MNSNGKPKELEPLGDAARRVLAGVKARMEIRASGAKPEPFAVFCRFSPNQSAEETGERRAAVEFRAQSLAGVIPTSRGEETGRELDYGRAGLPVAIPVSNFDPGTARPALDDSGGREDRATVTLLRMGD